MARAATTAGIYDHCGWAIFVCVSARYEVLDARRVELVGSGLPSLPHHGPGQRLPIDEAVELVEQVRRSATACAVAALDALPKGVGAIALRVRPALPPTIPERITSYWAQTRADGVMYRDVLAEAAENRGWPVFEYEASTVMDLAAAAHAASDDFPGWLKQVGKVVGPPWGRDQRLATAAAIVAIESHRNAR